MQLAQSSPSANLDRLIDAAILRIEQQAFHVAELFGSPPQAAVAQRVLSSMIEGLHQLEQRRAQSY